MLTATLKEKTCKHCKTQFTPSRPMQVVCGGMCGLERARIKREAKERAEAKAKNRQERAQFLERRAKLKRIPDLIAEAQKAFNAYIRERDRERPCICCGKPLGLLADDPRAATGGAFDCGHYRSTGSASHLRFDERNAHGQRKFCNRYGAGRAVDYRVGLIERIGLEAVVGLESSNAPHKWERDELIAIKAAYVQKLKQLKGAT